MECSRSRGRIGSTDFYRLLSVAYNSPWYSVLSRSTPQYAPHSHSIVLKDHNALIWQHKSLPPTTKNRLADPSEICALDFARQFPRFRICQVSATIGINRSIFVRRHNDAASAHAAGNTVSASGANPFAITRAQCFAGRRSVSTKAPNGMRSSARTLGPFRSAVTHRARPSTSCPRPRRTPRSEAPWRRRSVPLQGTGSRPRRERRTAVPNTSPYLSATRMSFAHVGPP
jgi:hypothetical protein